MTVQIPEELARLHRLVSWYELPQWLPEAACAGEACVWCASLADATAVELVGKLVETVGRAYAQPAAPPSSPRRRPGRRGPARQDGYHHDATAVACCSDPFWAEDVGALWWSCRLACDVNSRRSAGGGGQHAWRRTAGRRRCARRLDPAHRGPGRRPDPDLLLDSPDPGRDPAGPGRWAARAELRGGVLIGAAVAGLAAMVGFGIWLGAWLNEHWGVYAVVPQVAFMLLAVWAPAGDQRRRWEEQRVRGMRVPLKEIDALHHSEFEFAVRDLMRRDGFEAERFGGAHDDVCDVRGVDADGRIWVVQCKHKRDGWEGKAIGVEVLQRLNGTAETAYGARFAVIVTNGRFTLSAVERSETYGVHLIDRGRLELWAAEGRPLWTVLEGVKPARRLPGQRRRRPGQTRAAAAVSALGRQGRSRAS